MAKCFAKADERADFVEATIDQQQTTPPQPRDMHLHCKNKPYYCADFDIYLSHAIDYYQFRCGKEARSYDNDGQTKP